MSLFDEVASTEVGAKRIAAARLRRAALKALHASLAESGLAKTEIARRLGVRKSAVGNVFAGDGNLRISTLAEYLHAMGYELVLERVANGEPRRRLVEAATTAATWVELRSSDRLGSVGVKRPNTANILLPSDFVQAA